MNTFTTFDVADYLDSDEMIVEFLAAAIEDENPEVFIAALGHVAKVKGMSEIARETGLGRESLYKALKEGAKPRYETVAKVLSALGVRLTVEKVA
ncbi:addiction module antidote protein [Rhizobium sp. C4]|uniref:addiction module antidote protein n=1 Tax=Rhizobium sp. C4 TaxID=1349800 RepID=UPI001E521A1D|nr:addiction module antidote protein [Rhizobium sp. C4]MCD2171334.1 putative addiction module antidote protein [Rhizobium sp. C4]